MTNLEYSFLMIEALLLIRMGGQRLMSGILSEKNVIELAERLNRLLEGAALIGAGVYFYFRAFAEDSAYSFVGTYLSLAFSVALILDGIFPRHKDHRRFWAEKGMEVLNVLALAACCVICLHKTIA